MSLQSHVGSLQSMTDVWECYHHDLAEVEECIFSNIDSEVPLVKAVSMFILQGGGKRIRPLLLLLSSRVCGYRGHDVYPLASHIEYIHTATLLHDDVVDDADVRRGREAAHRIWGNQISILVGDYLYAKAVRSIVDFRIHELNAVIAESVRRMTEGEVMQLSLNRRQSILLEAEYLRMVEGKTGALIACACHMGAVLADAPPADQAALFHFGLMAGIAYQIADDMLDYLGEGHRVGKTLGNDIRQGKITLPLLHLLAHCEERVREDVLTLLERGHMEMHEMERIVAHMEEYGSVAYSMNIAAQFVEKAKAALCGFSDSVDKQALFIATDYMSARDQ